MFEGTKNTIKYLWNYGILQIIVVIITALSILSLVFFKACSYDKIYKTCEKDCFPKVSQMLNDKCYCATTKEEWKLKWEQQK